MDFSVSDHVINDNRYFGVTVLNCFRCNIVNRANILIILALTIDDLTFGRQVACTKFSTSHKNVKTHFDGSLLN